MESELPNLAESLEEGDELQRENFVSPIQTELEGERSEERGRGGRLEEEVKGKA